jgi:hypothetical protein
MRFEELMAFSRELHIFMRDHAKLTESEKPLLVSGTLIALKNKAFAKSFNEHSPEELQREWMRVIKSEINKADIPRAKKDTMSQPYSSIAVHPVLGKSAKGYPRGVLHELISRLNQGSCFDEGITNEVRSHNCDVGMLNPPFAQGDADLHELYFVKHMLDCLAEGGTGVAIVPMSCAISPHVARIELLKSHTLEAVMSMPDDLFYPVGTVTCIMVFTAKKPHAESDRKTWFGYWKNDGFVKTKTKGRIDLDDKWLERRAKWIEIYRNREVHAGESVAKKVTANDEWCAEAYMETDYSQITQAVFERVVRNYAIFKLLGAPGPITEADDQEDDDAET